MVGFHATYTEEGGNKVESGAGNALVGRYLTLLNLSEKAILFATMAPPGKLNYLTLKNATAVGIETSAVDDIKQDNPPPVVTTESNKDTALWSEQGSWTIRVDRTLSNSCFMFARWEKGLFLRIGINASSDISSYFFIGHQDWSSLQEGKKYRLKMEFDNFGPWDIPAEGSKLGESTLLYATFKNEKFWQEFTNAQGFSLSYNDNDLGNFRLAGSRAAFNDMIACQKHYLSEKRDPFAE